MHDTIFNSGWEFLVAVPSLGLLLISFLRLDQIIAAPKSRPSARRFVRGMDDDGELMMCDPDGKPWPKLRSRK